MTTVTRSVDFGIKRKERNKQAAADIGRVPRIAKLMALAIRYDQMLNDGVVKSQTELAELLHVSQPRMTQIMNLLHLSPEIQEELLHAQDNKNGKLSVHEHALREVTQLLIWNFQMLRWDSQRVDSF